VVLAKKRAILPLLFIVSFFGSATAQTSSYEELQAAYIFNFAKYIKWPEEKAEFVIGIYGEPEIMELFKSILAGKRVGGKPILVKIIEEPENMADCNIVYITSSASRKLKTLLSASEGKNILMVTAEDMISSGAAISFVVEDDKLKFKIKRKTLSENGLVASEGLLKLAILL
jgi:hypothetical protein